MRTQWWRCSARNAGCDVATGRKAVRDCAVTRGDVDLDWYAERDGVWRELGLAAPARRALVDAGILTLTHLRKFTLAELSQLHGIGKTALPKLHPYVRTR